MSCHPQGKFSSVVDDICHESGAWEITLLIEDDAGAKLRVLLSDKVRCMHGSLYSASYLARPGLSISARFTYYYVQDAQDRYDAVINEGWCLHDHHG